jgi:hypothetical protein
MPGKRGERGEKGERGIKGEQGPPGPALILWRINREDYSVKAVLSDGTEVLLPLRELFEQFQIETNSCRARDLH